MELPKSCLTCEHSIYGYEEEGYKLDCGHTNPGQDSISVSFMS
jgi:hypothetical protein